MVSLNPGKDPGLKQGAADIHQRIMSFTDGKFKPRGGSMIKTGGGATLKDHVDMSLLMVSLNPGKDPGLKLWGEQLIYTKGLCHLQMVSLNPGEDSGLKWGG